MEPETTQRIDTAAPSQDADYETDHEMNQESAAESAPAPIGGAPREARVTRALAPDETLKGGAEPAPASVARAAWLRDEEYWRNVTYISATGRRPGDRPVTRPLPRPDRFQRPEPLRSSAALVLVIALIILIPIGVVVAWHETAGHITIPTSIPGITEPTVTPATTPTLTPTATPKKKK